MAGKEFILASNDGCGLGTRLSSMTCVLDNFLDAAVNHLNGAMLYGKKIHVTLSKHTQVQMPQPGSNMSALVGLIAPLAGNLLLHFVLLIFTSLLCCRRMVSLRTTPTLLSIVSR